MGARTRLDSAYGRRGGHLVEWSGAVAPFYVGQTVAAVADAGFAAGEPVEVLAVMPGGRVRVAYGDVSDLVVPADLLELPRGAAPAPPPLAPVHWSLLAALEAGPRSTLDLVMVAGASAFERVPELAAAGLVVVDADVDGWAITDAGRSRLLDRPQKPGETG